MSLCFLFFILKTMAISIDMVLLWENYMHFYVLHVLHIGDGTAVGTKQTGHVHEIYPVWIYKLVVNDLHI